MGVKFTKENLSGWLDPATETLSHDTDTHNINSGYNALQILNQQSIPVGKVIATHGEFGLALLRLSHTDTLDTEEKEHFHVENTEIQVVPFLPFWKKK